MMEIVNHAKSVLGDEFKFCAGNAHTVSRVAAGLAFTGHRVILLSRYPHSATRPGKICLSRLPKHLELINKVGKLVREDSEFGIIFTSREHIFADGVNVRNLQRDLGMLILWNSKQKGYALDDLIPMVEISNRQKRVEDRERLYMQLKTFLDEIGYREHKKAKTLLMLRRILGRAELTTKELQTLQGIIGKAEWRIGVVEEK